MKGEPTPPDDGKTPHERFSQLGKKVLSVPRSAVAAKEKKWEAARKRGRKRSVNAKSR